MEWEEADDVKVDILHIIETLELSYIDTKRIHCYRTQGSKARAYARTWSFPKIFQKALNVHPAYVIEVLSKYYDKLHEDDRKKVLIHELMHIPKNFSGALVPHQTRHRRMHTVVKQLFIEYKKRSIIK